MKQCPSCKESKTFESFYKDKQKNDGLTSRCKICVKHEYAKQKENHSFLEKRRNSNRKSQKKRRSRQEVKDAEKDYRNNRYHTDPFYRAKTIKTSSVFRSNKRKKDPKIKMIDNCRRRFSIFLKGKRAMSFSKMLGCSLEFLKQHLESQFQPGMTWENYGKWHVDHIYPLERAYVEGKERFEEACKYTNLQPLWAADNIKKGNKINI